VSLALQLTEAPDATTTAALVNALREITKSAATMDDELFELLLDLVESLATTANEAGNDFLAILAVMLHSRGVQTETDSSVITSSLRQLVLAVLQDAICGETAPPLSADGMELRAAFLASFADQEIDFAGGGSVDFGNGTDFGQSGDGELPICKKSQILSQDTSPFTVPENSKFKYAGAA